MPITVITTPNQTGEYVHEKVRTIEDEALALDLTLALVDQLLTFLNRETVDPYMFAAASAATTALSERWMIRINRAYGMSDDARRYWKDLLKP